MNPKKTRYFLWPLIEGSSYEELWKLVGLNGNQLRERDIGKHHPKPKNLSKIIEILIIKQEEIVDKIKSLQANYTSIWKEKSLD